MAITIYGMPQSTCTQRVLTTLIEKNVDYNLDVVNLMKGEHKGPDHMSKQPFGKIPVLKDGDFTLFESRAMARYIATKYANQGTKLIPAVTDVEKSAIFDQWASVEKDNFDAFASPLIGQKVFSRMMGGAPNEVIVEHLEKSLTTMMDTFEGILAKQSYMGGNEFSLVDIFYMPYLSMLFMAGNGALITDRPHVKAWWDKVSERESWKKVQAMAKPPPS